MPGTYTLQVRRAINRLKAAGLARRDFSCRVERHTDGSYGDARVFLHIANRKARRYARALLAQGFGLMYLRRQGHPPHMLISDYYNHRGKIIVWDDDALWSEAREYTPPQKEE